MKRILVLFVALGLLAAACGSDSADTDAGSAGDESDSLSSEAVDDSAEDAAMESDDSDDSDGDGDTASDSDDDDGDAASGDVLDAAALDELLTATAEQSSGRFEAVMEMTGGPTSEIPGSVTIEFNGSFDEATSSSEISMDMSGIVAAAMEADPATADDPESEAAMAMMAPFFEEPMQVKTIGDRSWIKWGLLGMFGAGDKWLETDASGSDEVTQDFGFDAETPTDALSGLADSGQTVELIGEEEIRGVTASRYRSEIDVADMTAEQRAALGDDLPDDGVYVLNLWVADGLVHRFQIDMSDLEQTADNDLASIVMTYDLFDHGAAVEITPPSPDEVIAQDELGFDLGDLGGMDG